MVIATKRRHSLQGSYDSSFAEFELLDPFSGFVGVTLLVLGECELESFVDSHWQHASTSTFQQARRPPIDIDKVDNIGKRRPQVDSNDAPSKLEQCLWESYCSLISN
jgi:hypothetical protein